MIEKEVPSPCPSCGNTQFVPYLERGRYHIVRCVTCSLVHVNPVPSEAEIEAHYQDPTYFGGNEQQGYLNYADTERALLPHFNRRLDSIETRMEKRGRLLDFGCAAGFFLRLAKKRGWGIGGVELSRDMAESTAKTLHIPIATSLDLLRENDFDAITMWEVVEHLSHPVEVLVTLRNHLRPGGILMLSTPNTGHWQAVRDPANWEAYRPPSHLLYFNASTLEDILHRAGYESVCVQGVSPLPPMPDLISRMTKPLQRNLARGQAPVWSLSLYLWRGIRLLAWVWQKLIRPADDVFTTLEAVAYKPQ